MKSLIDIVHIGFAVFIALISIFIAFELMKQILPSFEKTNVNVTTTLIKKTYPFFEYFFLALYFGIPLIAIILAFISRGTEIALPFAIILLLISVLLNAIFKDAILEFLKAFPNIYEIYSNSAILQNAITYYPLIMFVFGCIIIIAQFVR